MKIANLHESPARELAVGHIKGAFTGASYSKQGMFESANKGTVFLDEISETSPNMQTKLLRVIE